VPRNTTGLKKGGPGRKPGVPNKASQEAKEVCARMVDNPRYLERLEARLVAGKLPPAIEALIWHYAKGKPKDTLQVEGQLGVDVTHIRESLASRIARLAERIKPAGVAEQPE